MPSDHLRSQPREYISMNTQTALLLDVGRVMNNTVALFDTVDDPSSKCLYGTRPVYKPEERFLVFVYHFPNKKDSSGMEEKVPYCLNLTATDSGEFSFGRCEDAGDQGVGQTLYFDGKSCYIGLFPISGTNHCILWFNIDYEGAVPEECLTQYDEKCGQEKYALYDKEECP
uniref:Uncharacterized protein n=1 Tax=Amblyomma maculatum TaxID=34609 RepID=G3MSX5_AMBMU